MRRDFGEVPPQEVKVVLHPGRPTGVKVVRERPVFIAMGWKLVVAVADHETDGTTPDERMFSAFGVLMFEELVHFWDVLTGQPVKLEHLSPEGADAVAHYVKDCQYRAFRYAVQKTGQRRELLAKVEQARKAREC
ncbi:hypothetical protein GTO10_02550 [Candidatus Saccharibacteria bacterium]|nr:hypothetical protein [Candidatus Saccharibacteria bacterium]